MAALHQQRITHPDIPCILDTITEQGWILLRGMPFSTATFSDLLNQLCAKMTFDPARDYASKATQKVDAGTDPVGLHIENGNTPLPPDIVAFYSKRSATRGSCTTVCDGAMLLNKMPSHLQQKFSKKLLVSRTLPEAYWRRYLASFFQIQNIADVGSQHLQAMLEASPGQSATLNPDGSLLYTLTVSPIINDNMANIPSFANAILGPSYNYERPVYEFEDGEPLDSFTVSQVARIAETCTREVQWQDNDVVIIDNKRVMHGRRRIDVPLEERELIIGMGYISNP